MEIYGKGSGGGAGTRDPVARLAAYATAMDVCDPALGAHAARVAAEEEEALRRVAEKRQMRPPAGGKATSGSNRTARKAVEAAERHVAELESRVRGLESALQDPALYGTPDGVRRAGTLGTELERSRSDLERAIEDWARATETLEGLSERSPAAR